jgi:hypothetical protein
MAVRLSALCASRHLIAVKVSVHRPHSLMKLSSSWEAVNCAATQELPSLLWNPKVHYRVHKSPLLVPILCQINPIHTIPSYLSKIHFKLSTHLRLGLPSGLFPSEFLTNILYAFLVSPQSCYMPCPSHPPWLNHSNYRINRLTCSERYIRPFNFNLYLNVKYFLTVSMCITYFNIKQHDTLSAKFIFGAALVLNTNRYCSISTLTVPYLQWKSAVFPWGSKSTFSFFIRSSGGTR